MEDDLGRKGPSAPILERGRGIWALARLWRAKGGGACGEGLAAGGRAGEPGVLLPRVDHSLSRAVPRTLRSLPAPELELNFPSSLCAGDSADTLRGAGGEAGKKKSKRGGGKEVPEGFISS